MGLTSGDKWFAVFRWSLASDDTDTYLVPIIAWEVKCVDGNDSLVGFVAEDRDGNDLPFPVPAQNVFGFIRYEKRRL